MFSQAQILEHQLAMDKRVAESHRQYLRQFLATPELPSGLIPLDYGLLPGRAKLIQESDFDHGI